MNIVIALIIFSLIIIIHELGHLLLAKKNGITVTEFSVGMGPRIISFDKGGTKYSIKALPFGGSCMMLGEDEDLADEGSFNSKGVWARISVILAGPIFNFILAFILALIVIGAVGIDFPTVNLVNDSSPIDKAGIKEGDTITKINGSSVGVGREIDFYFQFNPITEKAIEITYKRDGKKNKVKVNPELSERYLLGFTYAPEKSDVISLLKDYPFYNAGIEIGDKITKIDDTNIVLGSDISKYFLENPLTQDDLSVSFIRNGKESTINVSPKKHSEYSLGWDYNLYREKISPLKVLKYSFHEVRFWIVNTVRSVTHLIKGKIGMDQIAGPVGVVKFMDDIYEGTKEYGFLAVLLELINFSLLLSANLGVMNLLPIPALDGGRLVFLFIEAVRGKPIDREKEGIVHLIGIVALMALMVFVLFNDIRNIF